MGQPLCTVLGLLEMDKGPVTVLPSSAQASGNNVLLGHEGPVVVAVPQMLVSSVLCHLKDHFPLLVSMTSWPRHPFSSNSEPYADAALRKT